MTESEVLMGLFRRKQTIDLAAEAPAKSATVEDDADHQAAVHAGIPGRCPTCDGFGYIDHIDMVRRFQRQHCRACGHRWEFSFDDDGEVLDLTDLEQGSIDDADSLSFGS